MATHETSLELELDLKYNYTPGYAQTFDEPGEPEEFEFAEVEIYLKNGDCLSLTEDQKNILEKAFKEEWMDEIKQDAIDSRNP